MKENLRAYEIDASRKKGKAKGVFFPKTINELKNFVRIQKRICIRGGGSGLVGGSVPENGLDMVLDLSKLNNIGAFDKDRKTIEVEAGVILKDLEDYLEEFNLEIPINILSNDIATIGGIIATNAYGSRALKYGKIDQWIRWIEVMDSKGNLTRKGTTEISDYAGLEGISGIIVKACFNLIPTTKRTATILKINSKEEIIEYVKNFKKNPDVSMIEYFDKKVSKNFGLSEDYHLIVEYENESGEISGKEYENLIEKINKVYFDLAFQGYTKIEDPKVHLNKVIDLISFLEENKIPTFGSIGFGTFHPCFSDELTPLIHSMNSLVKRLSGQVNGKFGIGITKKDYLEFNDKKILINIKKRTDIDHKFNIGKVI